MMYCTFCGENLVVNFAGAKPLSGHYCTINYQSSIFYHNFLFSAAKFLTLKNRLHFDDVMVNSLNGAIL